MILGILTTVAGVILPMIQKRQDARIAEIEAKSGVKIAEIQANAEVIQTGASVIKTGMQFKVFWIPWSIAAIPAALWYAWGMLDSTIMGGELLTDTAALPPQLLMFTEAVWNSIFYSGAVMGSVQAGAGALSKAVTMFGRRR